MPNPSSIAMYDDAEIVDAEPVPEGPSDLEVVIAAVRAAQRQGTYHAMSSAGHRRLNEALDRLEAPQT